MSAEYFLVYYGICKTVTEEEMERDEWDENSSLLKVEATGLSYYDCFFGEEQGTLYVGCKIGVFGAEDEAEKRIGDDELLEIMRQTRAKLKAVGYEDEPALYMQWGPDL